MLMCTLRCFIVHILDSISGKSNRGTVRLKLHCVFSGLPCRLPKLVRKRSCSAVLFAARLKWRDLLDSRNNRKKPDTQLGNPKVMREITKKY